MHASKDKEVTIVECPHCGTCVEVIALNCKIFRCGVMKNTMVQINPHLKKDECDSLFSRNLIYGCGKPFRVDIHEDGKLVSSICDYI